jgi:YVTN family beta-propeller protein
VAFTPGSALAVVALPADDIVTIINVSSSSLQANAFVGDQPVFVAVDSIGTRAFVANSGSNTVSVVDLVSAAVVASINVGNMPIFIVLE